MVSALNTLSGHHSHGWLNLREQYLLWVATNTAGMVSLKTSGLVPTNTAGRGLTSIDACPVLVNQQPFPRGTGSFQRLLRAHIQSSLFFFFFCPCNHLRQRPHHGCRWRYPFYNYKPAKTSFYRNRTSGYSEISGMLLRFQTLFVQAAYARSF